MEFADELPEETEEEMGKDLVENPLPLKRLSIDLTLNICLITQVCYVGFLHSIYQEVLILCTSSI